MALAAVTWVGFGASMADAAQPDGPVTVVRTATSPTIDGHVTEAGWTRAAVISELTQAEPNEGTLPSERTRVYLLYDADNLYVGVRAYDSEPKRIAVRDAPAFYYSYHKQYLAKNPRGYCGLSGTGIACRDGRREK